MLRNYLSAALGNIGRNSLYAAITILGLAVSFAAAILIGLYVRDEYSFDRFIPGHERVYRLQDDLMLPGQKPRPIDVTQSSAAAYMKLDFPEVEYAARLQVSQGLFRKGAETAADWTAWVDPDFFKVMPWPAAAGDLNAALTAPDGLVLTQATARKYFGEDAPIGRTILVNPNSGGFSLTPAEQQMVTSYHPMRVLAVVGDPPASSHMAAGIFAAGRAAFSPLTMADRHPSPTSESDLTYLRLKAPVVPDAWARRLDAFARRHYARPDASGPPITRFWLAPLDSLHFTATGVGPPVVMRPAGDKRVDLAVAAVGALVVAIAIINFVTLMTARAARRAVEVGVRKASGARRRDLVIQFMGEALIYVAVAMVMAMVAAELMLGPVNAFLGRALRFDYATDLAVMGALAAAALLATVLAGLYPALVLSAFRPATALKGGPAQASGSAGVRQGLVIAQFAILIGLVVVTATIYRQTQFLLNDALRLDTDQVVRTPGPCGSAFEQQARSLPSVKALACSSPQASGLGTSSTEVAMPDRSTKVVYVAQMGAGFFELHGLKPVAGRFFARDHGEDMVLDRSDAAVQLQPSIVVNETAARMLGYADIRAAVGKTVVWGRWSPAVGEREPEKRPSQVIGVAPDFSFASARTAVLPTIYYVDPGTSPFLIMKLDRARIPETLDGLRRLWRQTGNDRPLSVTFETQQIQALYQDVITQGLAIGACSGLAILIACLGLFALAAFVTERRIKEIGVRKAMGASSGDVAGLLLWQFTQPVLWANLVAWPAAFFAMDWWLHGFAYRVSQPVWLFLAASVIAAAIAWATVSFQSLMAARARPATALRYE